jgi:hypothetical protein
MQPAQPGSLEPFERRPDRRRRHSNSTGDLAGRYATNQLQPKNFAHLAHGRSLCCHPVPPLEAKGADLSRPTEAPNPGEIIPEWWATSSQNGGQHHLGMVGGIIPESAANQHLVTRHVPFSDHRPLAPLAQAAQSEGRHTWRRITKLANDFLPRARILHPWPQERFAVKYPRWEPSARMGPARFCAGGANNSVRFHTTRVRLVHSAMSAPRPDYPRKMG